ncbi:hypothetical protein [Streptomyces sp. NPDC127033]|uniref:hypothetical protein n=1 Tax=Streptomyces sp. NPDC127033 TaxID=3347110 RepID=UPI00364A9095
MARIWAGLAVGFAALAVGSIASKDPGVPIRGGDLVTTGLLACLAWACWRARR